MALAVQIPQKEGPPALLPGHRFGIAIPCKYLLAYWNLCGCLHIRLCWQDALPVAMDEDEVSIRCISVPVVHHAAKAYVSQPPSPLHAHSLVEHDILGSAQEGFCDRSPIEHVSA